MRFAWALIFSAKGSPVHISRYRTRLICIFGACVTLPLIFDGWVASASIPGASSAQRATILLHKEMEDPVPGIICKRADRDPCDYGKLYHVLATLYVDGNDGGRLDAEIMSAMPLLAKGLGDALPAMDDERSPEERSQAFHFERAGLLYKIVRLFGANGSRTPHAISLETERAILLLFEHWGRSHCGIADTDTNATWRIWGSENHHAQLISSCWQAADLLRRARSAAFRYSDGSTAQRQYQQWTAYIIKYLGQRARFGLLEYGSPTYAAYSLAPIYDYGQFSSDPLLKKTAISFLDLWWAQWAAQQIDGNFGASMARVYPKALKNGSPMRGIAWVYFGLGQPPRQTAALSSALVSDYRPPSIVEKIATSSDRRSYSILSTAPGRLARPKQGLWFTVDPLKPAVLRTTYVAPGFVMGTATMPQLPFSQWAGASSQNRWSGVVLTGPGEARIVAYVAARRGITTYNGSIGVQSEGALLVKALGPPLAANSSALRISFGSGIDRVEQDGWVLVEGSAYVAVRPAQGGYRWDPQDRDVMIPNDPTTPVVIQAASKVGLGNLEDFIRHMAQTRLIMNSDYVDYTGLTPREHVRLFSQPQKTPLANGAAINFLPPQSISSPFVTMNRETGVGKIQYGSQKIDLQF
jgi:hypothetical protein